MPSPIAVRVRDLSKSYRIVSTAAPGTAGRRPQRGHQLFKRKPREIFEALRGVDFDVRTGEVVGIIGRNGAGKSTLLKVLSRITNPTAGFVELYGRVGSLLEVGTGFHSELTGRENVYLNGAILGMKRREIDARFDSIVEFAETSTFLDTPVKRYSSGMYVRLAFVVAAHLEPEILIVDEVLAVGDAAFQKKCLKRMEQASTQEGRTVLFVSHNMTAVESICRRGILLDAGRIVCDGPVGDAIDRYLAGVSSATAVGEGEFDLTEVARDSDVQEPVFRKVTLHDGRGRQTGAIRMGEPLTITIDIEQERIRNVGIQVRIVTDADRPVVTLHSHMKALELYDEQASWGQAVLRIPSLPLLEGNYWIDLAVREGSKVVGRKTTIDRVARAASFEVHEADVYGNGFRLGSGVEAGVLYLDQSWELRHDGIIVAATEPGR